MITISLNNEDAQVQAATVAELLEECGFNENKVAVAINTEFVPRSEYQSHLLSAGDCVDVLSAVQGG